MKIILFTLILLIIHSQSVGEHSINQEDLDMFQEINIINEEQQINMHQKPIMFTSLMNNDNNQNNKNTNQHNDNKQEQHQNTNKDQPHKSTDQDKPSNNQNKSTDQDKPRDNQNKSTDQDKPSNNQNKSTDQDKPRDNQNKSTDQDKPRDNPNKSTDQDKPRDNPNKSTDQDKPRDNPNKSTDQDKPRDNSNKNVNNKDKDNDNKSNQQDEQDESKGQQNDENQEENQEENQGGNQDECGEDEYGQTDENCGKGEEDMGWEEFGEDELVDSGEEQDEGRQKKTHKKRDNDYYNEDPDEGDININDVSDAELGKIVRERLTKGYNEDVEDDKKSTRQKGVNTEQNVDDVCFYAYEECNYQGRAIRLCGRFPTIPPQLSRMTIRSIQIPRHTRIEFYSQPDFQGELQSFVGSNRCLIRPFTINNLQGGIFAFF